MESSAQPPTISAEHLARLQAHIRCVPDFPKPGIVFRDITPLLANAESLALSIKAMAAPFRDRGVELVVGAESRGFIFGTSIARDLDCGFVPIRKGGKLPAKTVSQDYQLEYGTDRLEIHADAVSAGQKVLIVDDLLATGGTMRTCCELVRRLEGEIVGISFLIELASLGGRQAVGDYEIYALISYDAE